VHRHFGLPDARLGPTALAIGSFDGVHLGHRCVLERLVGAARRERLTSACITFDPHPRCVLDPVNCPQQITTLDERLSLMAGAGTEHVVVLAFTRELAGLSPGDFMARLLASMELRRLVVGYDFALGRGRAGDLGWLREYGRGHGYAVEVVEPFLLRGEEVHSSEVRRLLTLGEMEAANRLLGRIARCICVGFDESAAFFPAGRVVHTGNPVRTDVLRSSGARSDHPLGLLVFGGSGGARRINQATLDALRMLGPSARKLAITHQTGTADAEETRAGYAALGLVGRVEPFIVDMGDAYATADVVVARAGAMTCAELTAVGLPAVLVPYPYAADDHQRRNAEVLVRAGAAEMILDRELSGERLAATLRALIEDPMRRADMAARARALGRPDAADRVAEACVRLLPS